MNRIWLAVVPVVLLAVGAFAYSSFGGWTTVVPPARESLVPKLSPAQSGLEITYIANEGVLISSGDKQVLIDGLHREYARDYAFLPVEQREKIETAKPPFDKINLILVSHQHLDHFHPESVGRYLQHNESATLVSSQQVVNGIEKDFKGAQAIRPRVIAVTPRWQERVPMEAGGIEFEILGIRHGTGRHAAIQNLGHLIKLGSRKLLHVGDADTTIENFEKLNLDEEGIDVAFIPVWFLLDREAQRVVREHIKPKQIIAVHIAPAEAATVTATIRQDFPTAVAFTTMLEKRNY